MLQRLRGRRRLYAGEGASFAPRLVGFGREEVDCGTASTAGTGLFLYRRFTGHLVVPKPMMHSCPGSGNFPADDGIEAAAHHGRAHVHMNDEAADGCEGDDDVDGDGKVA